MRRATEREGDSARFGKFRRPVARRSGALGEAAVRIGQSRRAISRSADSASRSLQSVTVRRSACTKVVYISLRRKRGHAGRYCRAASLQCERTHRQRYVKRATCRRSESREKTTVPGRPEHPLRRHFGHETSSRQDDRQRPLCTQFDIGATAARDGYPCSLTEHSVDPA